MGRTRIRDVHTDGRPDAPPKFFEEHNKNVKGKSLHFYKLLYLCRIIIMTDVQHGLINL
jgi:hypothetical protein